ncbi:MAG TPA: hypothetical protein VM261_36360 [Kofleriaceae bacterium]|nr:hypothetical protein [Kofleriaceae bacterium]
MGNDAPAVFVFGHANLAFTTFVERYVPAIETMLVDQSCRWIVGDRPGAETLAVEYLKARTELVTVFHFGKQPRYSPDINGTRARDWQRRGGFDSYHARDDAALGVCTHVIAVDTQWDITRYDGTARALATARTLGRVDLCAASPTAPLTGTVRAHALVDSIEARHDTARSFAHILVELFPPWFDFAPARFSVLAWDLGLHLVVGGPSPVRDPMIGVISTSDSRNLRCATLATHDTRGTVEDIPMHYTPSDAQRAAAAAAIARMLAHLYRGRADTP